MIVKSIVNVQSIHQQNVQSSNKTASTSAAEILTTSSASSETLKKFVPHTSSSPHPSNYTASSNSSRTPHTTTTTTTSSSTTNASEKHHITLPLLIPDTIEYYITGLYNLDTFMLIVPTLLEIMFYETELANFFCFKRSFSNEILY
jgi:hypothetical protein